jgi:predicted nuclease of predicted toxin-antitoxin system
MRIRVSDVPELLSVGATFDEVLKDYPDLEREDILARHSIRRPADGPSRSPVCVRFLIDNQLPPALARFINSEPGCEATHVTDVGLRDASDAEVWQYASANGFVLVSKDEDFPHMALRGLHASLIRVRVGNCRRVFLIDLSRRLWPNLLERPESGDRISRFVDGISPGSQDGPPTGRS